MVKFLKSYDIPRQFGELASSSREIKIAIAYLKRTGFEAIKDALKSFIQKKGRLKVLVGLADQYITDPQALQDLIELRKLLSGEYTNLLQMRYYGKQDFHPKFFIFKGKNQVAVILGSSNLTGGGMSRNIEANVLLASGRTNYGPIKDIDDFFDVIWSRKGDVGPVDLTEEIFKRYKHNKEVYERLRKHQTAKKKPIPAGKFPTFKKKRQLSPRAEFLLLIEGRSVHGQELEGFCTQCDRPVTISKKWLDYWFCDKHRGPSAYVPSPEEKGEKGGIIRLLVDDAEVNAKNIEKLCSKPSCKEHVDLTNDFYWLVCQRCYNKINPNKRCRIPNSDNGFLYRLSRKEIWKS